MPAEIGLHRTTHLASPHREGGIVECTRHTALGQPTQAAASGLGTGVVGVGARQRGEIRACRAGLLRQLLRTRFGHLLVGSARIRRHLHQDVRDLALLGGGVLCRLLVVALPQCGLVDYRQRQRAGVHLDILKAHRLRAAVIARMRLVPILDLRRGDRSIVHRRRRHHHETHVATLAEQAHQAIEFGIGNETGSGQPARDQAVLQGVADGLFELAWCLRRVLRGQQQLVTIRVELAVDLEVRDLLDLLADLGVADHDPVAFRCQAHQLLVDHVVEELALVLHRLECLRVERVALLFAHAHALAFKALPVVLRIDVVGFPQVTDWPRFRC